MCGNLKKYFKHLLPALQTDNYYFRRKTEYTLLFLLILTPYIIISVILKTITLGTGNIEFIINLAFVALIALNLAVFKKGHVTASINFLTILGILKALELMITVNNTLFFVHIFLVTITGAAVHTKKYQLYSIYASSALLFAGNIIINHYYFTAGKISYFVLSQVYHSVYSGLVFILTVHFITKIIENEILLSCELEKQANTDMLTGAYNRRKFSQSSPSDTSDTERAFCMLDIDHFKKVNDNWGHETGDCVLRELCVLIRETLRTCDIFYRWGGEEFLMILSCGSLPEAGAIVERLRINVLRHKFCNDISITLSAGISMQRENEDFMTPVRRSDIALYNAKKTGRNRTEFI